MKDGDLERARWQPATADGRKALAGVAVFGWQPSEGARFELWDRGDPGDKLTLDGKDLDAAEVRAALNLEGVHELWRDADPQPRHPLAPLVRAWWKRPVEVEDRNGPPGRHLSGAPGARQPKRPARGIIQPRQFGQRRGREQRINSTCFPDSAPGKRKAPLYRPCPWPCTTLEAAAR